MGWFFSSRQSISSAMVEGEDDEEEELEEEDDEEEADVGVHTALSPYCSDLKCWCHTDVDYHDRVTNSSLGEDVDDELFERAMATLGAT